MTAPFAAGQGGDRRGQRGQGGKELTERPQVKKVRTERQKKGCTLYFDTKTIWPAGVFFSPARNRSLPGPLQLAVERASTLVCLCRASEKVPYF